MAVEMKETTVQVVDALARIGRVATAPEVAREWEHHHGGSMHQTKAFRHLKEAVAAGKVVRDKRKRWLLPEWAGGAAPAKPAEPTGSAEPTGPVAQLGKPTRLTKSMAALLREAVTALETDPVDREAVAAYMDSAYTLLRASRAT